MMKLTSTIKLSSTKTTLHIKTYRTTPTVQMLTSEWLKKKTSSWL